MMTGSWGSEGIRFRSILLSLLSILLFASLTSFGAAELEVTKTVTTAAGSCPGLGSVTIDEGEAVKYCYVVKNVGTALAVDVFVADDNGTPEAGDDTPITLSGLTDGNLAPGLSASGNRDVTLSAPGEVVSKALAFAHDGILDGPQVDDVSDPVTVTVTDLIAALEVTKTVTTATGSCPGSDSLT
ncbi:hypothetical protein IH601_06655, partial [Candidatus Bipolaricaulota bacterium]|nr:hypothetical protein [Candidatus Bipolaricaulota bacterium]